jgi:NADH-quinone oxidoreductase subunit J
MPGELILFYLFAAGALISAAVMLLPSTSRNPIHSAVALIVSFFFLAAIYAQLAAHLLAALQIIVYAGAIMVLFTFVIMLLNLQPDELQEPKLQWWKVLAAGLGLFVFGKLATAISFATADSKPVDLTLLGNQDLGSVRDVGRMIYTTNLVPFELASVLLLVAAVGAVVLAKKSLAYVERPEPPPARMDLPVNVEGAAHDAGLAAPADAGGHAGHGHGHH